MGRVTEVDIGSGELLSTTARVDANGRIVRRHAADLVGEVIRRMIFDGDLRAGDKVPQDDLAARLGVSRLPVREALTGLARDGLVTLEPHLGAYVAPFDDDTIRDHFEIVGMVQGLAAARLAQVAPAETLATLHALRTEVEASTGLEPVHQATMAFHRVINREGGSERQRSVLRALASSSMFPERLGLRNEGWPASMTRSSAGRLGRCARRVSRCSANAVTSSSSTCVAAACSPRRARPAESHRKTIEVRQARSRSGTTGRWRSRRSTGRGARLLRHR
jgi:DNA-binding GntR family transcriptional regulator